MAALMFSDTSSFGWNVEMFNFGINQEVEAKEIASSTLIFFQHHLKNAEFAAEKGDSFSCDRYMNFAADILSLHNKYSDVVGNGLFVRMRLIMEYSIARMVNNRIPTSIAIRPSQINNWLRNAIAYKNPFHNKHIQKQEDFKRLLIVGASIELYFRENGTTPSSLDEICDIGAVKGIHYVQDGNFWKIRLGVGEQEPFYDFFPAVDDFTGTCYDELWFASTYSSKRKELYLNGSLSSEDARCSCYIANGVIRRGLKSGRQ